MNAQNVFSLSILGAVVLLWGLPHGPPPPPTVIVILPNGDETTQAGEDWRKDVLGGIGNFQPSNDILQLLEAWELAEGGSAQYNPLNTTWEMEGDTCYNPHPCVKNYASYEDGVEATIKTLTSDHPGYDIILSGLQQNDPQRVIDGIAQSPWGTNAGAVRRIYNGMQNASTLRSKIITTALAQVGKSYILGTQGPDTFDCSGLVQWVYGQEGIETGRTTFDQLAKLPPLDPSLIQPGDMVYFQFPWDQHTGILADIDGDGQWDMINAGSPDTGVVVTNNVFSDPFWTDHIIGYRSAL
jgi:cell wall-associated NlpC family hydrolase